MIKINTAWMMNHRPRPATGMINLESDGFIDRRDLQYRQRPLQMGGFSPAPLHLERNVLRTPIPARNQPRPAHGPKLQPDLMRAQAATALTPPTGDLPRPRTTAPSSSAPLLRRPRPTISPSLPTVSMSEPPTTRVAFSITSWLSKTPLTRSMSAPTKAPLPTTAI